MPPAHDSSASAGAAAGGWAGFVADLASRVQGLDDGGRVTVTAQGAARPAKLPGLGRRLLGTQYADVGPWVRLERVEDHAIGRCVSDHKEIGFPLAAEEKAALATIGWHEPGHGDGAALLRWFPDDVPSAAYLPESDAHAAAETAARTMREVFGITDPAELSLT